MNEAEFIAALRPLATSAAARDLLDDTAVLRFGTENLVLTHDMIVEGVHYLATDPPADVAWKLVAVNLSDLAAKGARPLGVLLGYSLGDDAWDEAFVDGLGQAVAAFGLPLLGGDTVAMPAGAPRALGLTALGTAPASPPRSGAQSGDFLWVSGSIGDAGAGLRLLQDVPRRKPGSSDYAETGLRLPPEHEALVERYRRPRPHLQLGQALAPLVRAMMDVSDGLLIDTSRMAAASGLRAEVDLASIPLSPALLAFAGDGRDTRIAAAASGDDYELLFAAPEDRDSEVRALSSRLGIPLTRIGRFVAGSGLVVSDATGPVALPDKLGWEHG